MLTNLTEGFEGSIKSPEPTGIGRFIYVREEFWFHKVFGLPVAQLFSLGVLRV